MLPALLFAVSKFMLAKRHGTNLVKMGQQVNKKWGTVVANGAS
jgi:hypothetical protein